MARTQGGAIPLFPRAFSPQNGAVHPTQLSYALATHRDATNHEAPLGNPLMALLQAVQDGGSIAAAATTLGLSYRHVWGQLKHWEQRLGHELIHWERGQPARLSELGQKVLRAERQAQARLAPQIDTLRAELDRSLAMAFGDSSPMLGLHASHDDTLVLLREHAANGARGGARLHLDIHFCGSVDAIRDLSEGRCLVAGFHAPSHAPADSHVARTYRPLLQPDRHHLIGFSRRTQGLMVAPGNPLKLGSLADVARTGARFAQRPLGSGTRALLADLLDQAGLAPEQLHCGDTTEPCHAAVAQAVLSGLADAGLGPEPAARARGLDFVPLVQENHFLACLTSARDLPPVRALCELLRSAAWQRHLDAVPGCLHLRSGEVLNLKQALSW